MSDAYLSGKNFHMLLEVNKNKTSAFHVSSKLWKPFLFSCECSLKTHSIEHRLPYFTDLHVLRYEMIMKTF